MTLHRLEVRLHQYRKRYVSFALVVHLPSLLVALLTENGRNGLYDHSWI